MYRWAEKNDSVLQKNLLFQNLVVIRIRMKNNNFKILNKRGPGVIYVVGFPRSTDLERSHEVPSSEVVPRMN